MILLIPSVLKEMSLGTPVDKQTYQSVQVLRHQRGTPFFASDGLWRISSSLGNATSGAQRQRKAAFVFLTQEGMEVSNSGNLSLSRSSSP